jgi:hypothetical protein
LHLQLKFFPLSGAFLALDLKPKVKFCMQRSVTAGQLIGADNALALARLRMDIECELRRIALETQIDLSLRPVGIKALARELVSKEVLPVTLMDPWRKWRKSVTLRFMGEKSPMMSPPQLSESGDSYWSSCACCQSSHSKLSVTFKM